MASGRETSTRPPLVLVHGLFDTPRVFERLERRLAGRREPLLLPALPLRFGIAPIQTSAQRLAGHIEAAFGGSETIDILGFSMGGVIARTWIQLMGGHVRTRRFLSLGSPQQGTLTAQPWPRPLLAGVADLKLGSALLRQLNADLTTLQGIDCSSYGTATDLMVLPGWHGVLPIGPRRMLPVWSHQQLLRHPAALDPVVEDLLRA
ncbi:triacylglycerol lipase [Cyanobium sp. Aljojuca 7A6]|nr:alpha/beta hydrolase [Cyanobium sp. Aljojuca 7A6]MCP9834743.1 alpha/beta hydrolase [Cyanobium sp. La Preciosa 7G6]MCP9937396.1 alpha/beta hydrolase [Cyanobium sp. Aljojuca 7A6]